jgi:hypothetical protein
MAIEPHTDPRPRAAEFRYRDEALLEGIGAVLQRRSSTPIREIVPGGRPRCRASSRSAVIVGVGQGESAR